MSSEIPRVIIVLYVSGLLLLIIVIFSAIATGNVLLFSISSTGISYLNDEISADKK